MKQLQRAAADLQLLQAHSRRRSVLRSRSKRYIADHSDAQFSHGICPTCYVDMEKQIGSYAKDRRARPTGVAADPGLPRRMRIVRCGSARLSIAWRINAIVMFIGGMSMVVASGVFYHLPRRGFARSALARSRRSGRTGGGQQPPPPPRAAASGRRPRRSRALAVDIGMSAAAGIVLPDGPSVRRLRARSGRPRAPPVMDLITARLASPLRDARFASRIP